MKVNSFSDIYNSLGYPYINTESNKISNKFNKYNNIDNNINNLNTIHVSIMVNNQQIQNQINPVVISGETPCITPYTRPIINQNNNEKETKSQKKLRIIIVIVSALVQIIVILSAFFVVLNVVLVV